MTFSLNRNNIIIKALDICGVIGENQNPSSSQISKAADSLNMIIEDLNNVLS